MTGRINAHSRPRPSHAQEPARTASVTAPRSVPHAAAAKPRPAQPRSLGHSTRDHFEHALASPAQHAATHSPAGNAFANDLRGSKTFQALPRKAQRRLLALARTYGGSAQARKNISAVAQDRDFGRLGSAAQTSAIHTLRSGIRQKKLGHEVSSLASDRDFRRLPSKDQRGVLSALSHQAKDPRAREAIAALGGSSGFRRLSSNVRTQLTREVGTPQKGERDAELGRNTLRLVNSPEFRKLSHPIQQQLLTAIGPNGVQTESARSTLVALGQRGLAGLDEASQKSLLGMVQDAHGDDPSAYNDDLVRLARGEGFRSLPPVQRASALSALGFEPGQSAALDARFAVAGSEGFAALSSPERGRLLQLAFGHNPVGDWLGGALGKLLNDSGRLPGDATTQAATLRKFIQDPALPDVSSEYPGGFGSSRPYTLSAASDVSGCDFHSGAADAIRYDVNIDGQTISVYLGRNTNPGQHSPTIDEVAKGLASIPAANRALIQTVEVNGQQNPDDAFFAAQYGEPGFRSYMTAGAAGIVSIYPTDAESSQHELTSSLVHETGHVLSSRAWGPDSVAGAGWANYRAAIAADGLTPSEYAKDAPTEDFSESLTLYQLVQGTPEEAEVRAMFSHRFAIIDQLLSGGVA